MIQVLKAAVAFGGKDVVLRMHVKDHRTGILFTASADGREFTGIQMPVRLS